MSKPLQAALWLTAVLTVVVLMKPEAPGVLAADAPALQKEEARAPAEVAVTVDTPWVRAPEDAWTPPEAEQPAAVAPPAPPPAPPPPTAIAPPPEPVAPDPAMRYLGRLDQDGRRFVFLGVGDDAQVVEVGAAIDGVWKVEKVTATQVELRYLPLNQIRAIATH
ncbi:hypothetical protein GCM10023165_33320 [Variovorax defluvii]|uniref:Uncharacterized protein n=1 Tax=Variovorax defluvii TaxID=913761 RepID=A0ABP8HZ89_9BURK